LETVKAYVPTFPWAPMIFVIRALPTDWLKEFI
jgi:hypothetical protein